MTELFNQQEEAKLLEIIQDYRTVYERATFLSIEMAKMEEEMSDLIKKMDGGKETETEIYAKVNERTGVDIEEIKKAAAMIALKSQSTKNSQNSEN